MVEIKGLEKFAPKDFSGHISSTVFLGGCNFRCPFCHNADLVLNPQSLPTYPLDYFIDYLDSRRGWLEGVCVSGGEPLMHKELEVLLTLVKDRKMLVKIDTNGSFPQQLKKLLDKKLIDSIAMDVKAPFERYAEVTASDADPEAISACIKMIRNSGLEYIFRTTVVPGLIDVDDIREICRILDGAEVFQIQQFAAVRTIDREFLERKPYSREKLEEFAEAARPHFPEVRIEGV